MEKKRFILRSEGILADAIGAVMMVEPGQQPLMEVVLRPYHRDRSLEQNDRLWALHGAASDYTGEDIQSLHEACCRRFLGTYQRRNPLTGEALSMTNTTTRFWDSGAGKIRKLTIAEMTKFMNEVEHLYIEMGIPTAHIRGEEKEKAKESAGDER